MPAVCRPSWATPIPLPQCIIHEPPSSGEDSPGDSGVQQCRTAMGWWRRVVGGWRGGVCEACSTFVTGPRYRLGRGVWRGVGSVPISGSPSELTAGPAQLPVSPSKTRVLFTFFFLLLLLLLLFLRPLSSCLLKDKLRCPLKLIWMYIFYLQTIP